MHVNPVVAVLPMRPTLIKDRSTLIRVVAYAAGWLVYIVSIMSTAIEKMLRLAAFYIGKAVRMIWRVARIIALKAWSLGVKMWYFAEPFLRDFDHWLNVMVHKSKIASEILDILEACWKELRARWQRADIRARNVVEDR